MSWDYLRTFEAVARLGSLTAAAKALKVSQSTVSRHLHHLEGRAGSPLLLRESPVQLTDRGRALLLAVEPMVESALAADSALEASPELRGQVTLTTVGEVLRWVLVEGLSDFHRRYPEVRLRILADNQVNSLAAGEADLALRFGRPDRGELVARRLRTMRYGYYLAEALEPAPALPWLGLTGSLARIPEQRHAERAFAPRAPRLLVEDLESLGRAVKAGLGVAILPRRFAAELGGLREVAPEQVGAHLLGPIAPRDLWLVIHRSRQHLPKVRAVVEWLLPLFAEPGPDEAAVEPGRPSQEVGWPSQGAG